jgi:hypothetical protein
VTSYDTGNRPLNVVLNKALWPLYNILAFTENIPLAMVAGIDDALKHSPFQMEYQAAQDMMPLEGAMGLKMQVGPALDYSVTWLTTNQRLRSLATAPAFWFMGAGGVGGGIPQAAPAAMGVGALSQADSETGAAQQALQALAPEFEASLPSASTSVQASIPPASTSIEALSLVAGEGRATIAVGDLGRIGAATSKPSFRRLLISIVREPSHPLHRLLNTEGKLTSSTARGINELVWFENPNIIEAGHYASAKGLAGAPDRLVMMSAYENRLLSATLEHPGIGGEMLEAGKVLSIGGVPVDLRTAAALVEYGLLDAEVFANAPIVIY